MVTTYLSRTDCADRARGYHSIFVRFSHSIGRPPSVEPVSDSPWRADWTFQRRRATLMPASFLLESFHAHRGPPCCATFTPIAARLSSWLKAAVASGRRRVGNARTQRKGEVIGRALSTLAATPGLLNMLSSQSACTPGAAGLGLHPPTDTAHTARTPHPWPTAPHGRESRAPKARVP